MTASTKGAKRRAKGLLAVAPAPDHPRLFSEEGGEPLPRKAWGWGPCVYCHGQGWTTPVEWIWAWAHPEYPDMERVSEDMAERIGPVDLASLQVRQRCAWCNGAGRRYCAPKPPSR